MHRVNLLRTFAAAGALLLVSAGLIFLGFTSAASQQVALRGQQPSTALGATAEIHGGVELTATALHAMPPPDPRRSQRIEPEGEAEAEESLRKHSMGKPARLVPPRKSKQVDERNFVPAAPAPDPVTSWQALVTPAGYAADTGIAVSSTHLVQTTRQDFGFYDKSGRLLQRLDTPTFFAPLNLDHDATIPAYKQAAQMGKPLARLTNYFDARVLFDPYRKRFWLGSLVYNTNTKAAADQCLSKFVVGVSKTENPLDGWYLYWWDAVAGDGSDYLGATKLGNLKSDGADYPVIGVDQFGFYQENSVRNLNKYYAREECYEKQKMDPKQVCEDDIGDTVQLSFFPAQPLANGTSANGWTFGKTLKNPNGTAPFLIHPAIQHGASATTYFVSFYTAEKLLVWKLTNHLQPNMQLQQVEVPIKTLSAPVDANQRGNNQYPSPGKILLTNPGNNVLRVIFRNNRLWVTLQDGGDRNSPNDSRCRIVRIPNISSSTLTPDVDQTFGGGGLTNAGFPALEVNSNNDAAIVFAYVSVLDFPSIRYTTLPGAATAVSEDRLLKAGEDPYVLLDNGKLVQLLQLHDLNSASLDPYDNTAVWLAAPYSLPLSQVANNNYAIWVGKIFGQKHPDLIVDELSFERDTFKPGDEVNFSARIRNQGDGASRPARYTVYLSTNPLISPNDRTLGEVQIGALNAGAVSTLIDTKFKVPLDQANGIYYLGVIVDSGQQSELQFQEYSTNNNSGRAARRFIVRKEEATTFLPSPGTKWHESFGFGAEIPRVGDFNGDDRDDIVAFNRSSGDVFVALSDGTKFVSNAQAWHNEFSLGNETPLVGDFNGDGLDDIATFTQDTKSGTESFEVYVALSDGSKFGPRLKWHDSFSGSAQESLAAADVNGDGKDDILDFTTGKAYVALSDGTRFGPTQVWSSNCLCSNINSSIVNAVADINRDGRADLIAFSRSVSNVFVYLSDGGKFGTQTLWASSFAGGSDLPAAGDFNGDGRDDIIYFTRGAAADVFTALSTGTSFKSPKEKWHDFFAANQETPLVGDFNGDGADDIATFLLGGSGDVYVALARRPSQFASLSASSYSGAALAKESIVAAFGVNLAAATQIAATVPLPTELAGTTVQITDSNGTARLAPLFFVSPGQINYQIPPGTTTGEALVTVTNRAGELAAGTVQITNVAPGLFTANASGHGLAAAVLLRVRANGAQQFEPVTRFDERLNQIVPIPIDFGPQTDQLFLIMYGAGFRFASSLAAVTMQIGGTNAQVLYAGPQGGFVGLDQLNAALPRSLAGRGTVDIALTVDRQAANLVQVSFK